MLEIQLDMLVEFAGQNTDIGTHWQDTGTQGEAVEFEAVEFPAVWFVPFTTGHVTGTQGPDTFPEDAFPPIRSVTL